MSIYEYREQVFSLRMGERFDIHPHLHSHLEIVYMVEGSIHMSVNREQTLLDTGDMAVVFPNLVHSFKATGYDGGLQTLIFSPSLLRQNRHILQKKHPIDPFLRASQLHPDVVQAMSSLRDEVDHADEQLCPILFDLVMARVLPLLTLTDNTETLSFDVANRAVGYLQEHFADPTLTLDTVAKHLGVTRFSLSRLFTGELGLTFSQFLRYLRVEQGKALLRDSSHTVLDIAMDCGFNSLRSFERAFAEQCGCSPRTYRAK